MQSFHQHRLAHPARGVHDGGETLVHAPHAPELVFEQGEFVVAPGEQRRLPAGAGVERVVALGSECGHFFGSG